VAARGTAPVIGALCESSEHKKKPRNAEEERKQAEEQQSLQDIPDDDRLILKDAPRRQPWTVGIGYRFQPSSRHFVGTVEQKQRELLHNQVQNIYSLFDFSISRVISRRWSLNASIPLLVASRDLRPFATSNGIERLVSQGDMTIGARTWIFRPPTESGGNIAIGMNLKLPTGAYNATSRLLNTRTGQTFVVTDDQSIQAGDGRVGFSLDFQAFHPAPLGTMLYLAGSYLFNPANTNGVSTGRSLPGEQVMSVPDQYLLRGGIARAVPGVRGLAVTFGGRWEGVPVRDVFGKSDGFRRPGYAISADPGFMYARGSYIFSCNIPWAVERNRKISLADYQNHTHGDAAFADYSLNFSVSRRF
jgi:hypothetical protein